MKFRCIRHRSGRSLGSPVFLASCIAATVVACSPEVTGPSAESRPTGSTAGPNLSAASAVSYRIRDLGTLGGASSEAADINNANVVVGISATRSGPQHAFRWQNGRMTDLGTIGGAHSGATAINNEGVIVGWSLTKSGAMRAVRWMNGVKRNLGTLGGSESKANDVNELGWIIGESRTASGEVHGFIWKNGVMTDLGTLGGSTSRAFAINRAGVIVGASSTTGFNGSAFRWRSGTMRPISSPGMGTTAALGINGGYIVGQGEPSSNNGAGDISNALVWANGVMTDLGRMGGTFARALDVSTEGVVVGLVDEDAPDCLSGEAFTWKNGVSSFLPKLTGAIWAGANAINRTGRIVGFSGHGGDCENVNKHAVLWTPN